MSEPTLDRRHFLKWMGLGTAVAGERILGHGRAEEHHIQGIDVNP